MLRFFSQKIPLNDLQIPNLICNFAVLTFHNGLTIPPGIGYCLT